MYQVHFEKCRQEVHFFCKCSDLYTALLQGVDLFISHPAFLSVHVSHYGDDGHFITDAVFIREL